MEATGACRMLELPNELIQHILSFLGPTDLARCAVACRSLHALSLEDCIWHPIVNSQLSHPIDSPAPLKSFRDLYSVHHPYWFLTRHRVWFADSEPNGKLLMARYEPSTGCIEAHQVTASRGHPRVELWEKNHDVIIHSFEPKVMLNHHRPVIRIGTNRLLTEDQSDNLPSNRAYAPSSRYNKEIVMETFAESGLYASLALCRPLVPEAIGSKTKVWPPLRIPSDSRTRNESHDGYTSTGHRPTRLSEVSQDAFRLRKWVEYTGRRSSIVSSIASSVNGGLTGLGFAGPYFSTEMHSSSERGMHIRFPEDIATFATLPGLSYLPTAEKPWQGIWCGDYSGHGCEFLLITQPDKQDETPLPDGMSWLRNWLRTGRRNSVSSDSSFSSAHEELPLDPTQPGLAQLQLDGWTNIQNMGEFGGGGGSTERDLFTDQRDAPRGRLEAIKLTGDPNVPRGEYTFIAPDIGHDGFLRVADETAFNGARIVRSAGHIAGTGFREDQYTPSQLIMISHDRLAQLWMGFRHISYYQRVDLDALMHTQSGSTS